MTSFKAQLINAVAAAAALGAGSTVISLKVHDADQDARITRIESLDGSVMALDEHLQLLDKHLSQLDGRFEQQDAERHGR